MLKAAEGTSVEDRARMAVLAQACVCLAQGVAFFHAGDEILRSKSLDRDAYNSGAQPMLPLCFSAQSGKQLLRLCLEYCFIFSQHIWHISSSLAPYYF